MKQVTLKCLPPPLKRVMKAFKNIYQLTILREKIASFSEKVVTTNPEIMDNFYKISN